MANLFQYRNLHFFSIQHTKFRWISLLLTALCLFFKTNLQHNIAKIYLFLHCFSRQIVDLSIFNPCNCLKSPFLWGFLRFIVIKFYQIVENFDNYQPIINKK